jgi:hypothetical protein
MYVWEIWVYSPDGGVGISLESRPVVFSSLASSAAEGDPGANALTLRDTAPRPEDPEIKR